MTHASDLEVKPCRHEPPLVVRYEDEATDGSEELINAAWIWFVGIIIGSVILGGLIGYAIGRFAQ